MRLLRFSPSHYPAPMVVFPTPRTWVILFLCSGFLFFQFHGVGGALNAEGRALLSFKWSITEDAEGALSNWNESDQDPCFWNGVTCRGGSVVSLSVPKKKLLGTLPPDLGNLSSLRHINLRNNRLQGGLPAGLLAGARGLQSLVLYGNSISGPLPSGIGNLSYLQILDVSHNSMNGSLPLSLLKCQRLRSLDLSSNNFTGHLPPSFGNSFTQLEKLNLSSNGFSGPIPSGIGNLSSLQGTLDLSHNVFSGAIPASLGELPEKVYIDLTYNNLSGPIPQNGALINRGPTAFIGNPGLCGPPITNPCSAGEGEAPSSFPYLPTDNSTAGVQVGDVNKARGRRGLSTGQVIAIVVGDIAGISLIALVFLYCYWRATSSAKEDGGSLDKRPKEKKECLCFRNDESEVHSVNIEQLDLIVLDRGVNFDLDELLKASAFVLGKSGIGIVYKVVLEDGLTLAVRRLGEGGSQRFKEFQAEVEAIGKVRHPNIVCLKAYYWSVDEKLLIYEYIPDGNLTTAIHGKAGMATFCPLPWPVRLKIMKGIARGMVFLHEFSPKKYVHGDLKPNNILLGANMEPFVADFGLGRLANIAVGSPTVHSNRMGTEKPSSQSSDMAVTPILTSGLCYQAPESLKTLKPSQKWDVYSYGVILLEIITGRSPMILLSTSEMDLVRWVQVCIEEKKPLSEVLDPYLARESDNEDEIIGALKIALACVQTNPERRPSMRHVLDTLERLTVIG